MDGWQARPKTFLLVFQEKEEIKIICGISPYESLIFFNQAESASLLFYCERLTAQPFTPEILPGMLNLPHSCNKWRL